MEKLSRDMRRLIFAGREIAYGNQPPNQDAVDELNAALEAFSANPAAPWEGEPVVCASDRSPKGRDYRLGSRGGFVMDDAVVQRFWSKVDQGPPDECWPWRGWKSGNGYGRVQISGRAYVASRVALELSGVQIPEGHFVCHRCDNPPCCNPAHLFTGTLKDNNRDRHEKGRSASRGGERNPRAKLSVTDVQAIRSSARTNVALAAHYGVHHTTISDIRRGKNWPASAVAESHAPNGGNHEPKTP